MRSKSSKYSKEQADIVNQIAITLNLDEKSEWILDELDKNDEVQNNILSLIPKIREYYNCNNLKCVSNPTRIKRPWLSIIKTLLKPVYNISGEDYHYTDRTGEKPRYIHTQKYTFIKIEDIPNPMPYQAKSTSPEDNGSPDGVWMN